MYDHCPLALSLLVTRIGRAHDVDLPLPSNNLTVFADASDTGPDFHRTLISWPHTEWPGIISVWMVRSQVNSCSFRMNSSIPVTVHVSGSGSFFGVHSRVMGPTSPPKNVP